MTNQPPKVPPTVQALRDKMQKNMLYFGRVCLPQMFSAKSPAFHKEIAKALHDPKVKRLNIIAPRGHAKSSLVAGLYVLYHILFDPGPHVVVLVSKTEGHAIRLLQTIKNALDYSIPLRAIFGYRGEHVSKKWSHNEIILDNDDLITTRGTGQQVIGLKHNNQRPTLIILDDPEDMENTKTSERMEYNLRWLLQSLSPALDPQRGRVIVIGTPQHQRCMVETLRQAEGWKTMFYQAIINEAQKEVLWPEWQPFDRLMEEKKSLESIGRVSVFYREYQCQVIGEEDQIFKESYMHTWKGRLEIQPHGFEHTLVITHRDGKELKTAEHLGVLVFMGVDPASTTSVSADYSTIVAVAVDAQKRRYVLPYFRGRVTPLVLADRIIEYFGRYRPLKTRIESVGYQEMLREYLRSKAQEKGIYIPGLEIKESPRTAKSVRLESMEPFFASHNVFLPEGQDEAMRDELLLYPRAQHDDTLDGLYYATKGVFPAGHEGATDNATRMSAARDETTWGGLPLHGIPTDDGDNDSSQFQGFVNL